MKSNKNCIEENYHNVTWERHIMRNILILFNLIGSPCRFHRFSTQLILFRSDSEHCIWINHAR